MISDLLQAYQDIIKDSKSHILFNGITKSDISVFEHANSIILPHDYAEFLCLLDGGELYLPAGIQIWDIA